MEKSTAVENAANPLEPKDLNALYTNDIEFDYLEAWLTDLKPRLSRLQEILFLIIRSIACEERKKPKDDGDGLIFRDQDCRLSISQYQNMAAARMPGRSVSRIGIRCALKVLQKRELIVKSGTWRGRNKFIPIDSPPSKKNYAGIKVLIEVQADPGLHRTAEQIFSRIEYMLRDGKRIYIHWSNKKLADDLGASEFNVDNALRELKREKYIVIRNGRSKFRKIGLHPEWKSLHAHLVQDFKQNRLVGMIEEKAHSQKIMRRLKKKGVVVQEDSSGQKTVILPEGGGDSFAGSRNDKGDSFAGSRGIVLLEVGNQEQPENITKKSDFQAPNKNKIINKGIKDKKDLTKVKSRLPDGKREGDQKIHVQEDACPSDTGPLDDKTPPASIERVPVDRAKAIASLKDFLAVKKRAALSGPPDPAPEPWTSKMDAAPPPQQEEEEVMPSEHEIDDDAAVIERERQRHRRLLSRTQWYDGNLVRLSYPRRPAGEPPPEDYLDAADWL